MEGPDCPCGLGEEYGACCGRFHAGAAAPTAELLMRSRYSAFALGDAAYLLRTWHSSTRPRMLELDPACRWARLAVLETHGGGLFDAAGTVSFRAVYLLDGRRNVLDETSRFVREAKRWVYLGPVDGQAAGRRALAPAEAAARTVTPQTVRAGPVARRSQRLTETNLVGREVVEHVRIRRG